MREVKDDMELLYPLNPVHSKQIVINYDLHENHAHGINGKDEEKQMTVTRSMCRVQCNTN